jgi:hypothetical protein
MRDFYVGKPNEKELNDELLSQEARAENILSLLEKMYPYRKSAVILYDEQTPRELYSALQAQVDLLSLHKIGYGTNSKDKPIIGGVYFPFVHASPLYNDEKPLMHSDTPSEDSSARKPDVTERLTETVGPHGTPYITTAGGLLMSVPKDLQKYSALSDDPRPALQNS